MGGVFLVHLFGHKKTYKIETQFLVGFFSAERQGFEPWIPEGITVFETAPIDHSGISPNRVFKASFRTLSVQRYKEN